MFSRGKSILSLLLVAAVSHGVLLPGEARALYAGGPVSVRAVANKDSVRVGERLRIRMFVDYADSLEFHPPSTLPEGKCKPVSIKWRNKKIETGKESIGDLVVYTLDLEEAFVPPIELFFTTASGETLKAKTPRVEVPVRTVTREGSGLAPLKKQWEAPASRLFPVLLALSLVLVVAGIILFRKLRKKQVVKEEVRPLLPPDVVALKELARIERLKLLESGEFKEYYTLVIDAIRRYLEGRFGVDAMDRTPDEILSALSAKGIRIDNLEEMLGEATLVKFAKHVPGIVPGKRLMERSRKIIADTSRREEEKSAEAVQRS